MSTALATLTSKLATRLEMGDGTGLIDTLKATAFKGQVSDAQMTALMVVANQYGLNPWTKEIYAFPDKNNGIVPVVGVDGWSRIINQHPQFDGMDFEQDEQSCTCVIYRKDRSHPIRVTEYMAECRRTNVGPWQSHPRRMLRHKAMIQCARLAFGYGGIYDQDEAERIVESSTVIDATTGEVVQQAAATARTALPLCPADNFAKKLPTWRKQVEDGGKVSDLLAMLQSKYTLSPQQLAEINALAAPSAAQQESTDQFLAELNQE
ncbi:phage recombination protein Bet [Hydrogenophaga sp. T2]|uniref:phage recombination protein Bet n=1 Tax=Hydrogenophaga sp. T2 TaxID=3132823 RepID=UPI003CE6876B